MKFWGVGGGGGSSLLMDWHPIQGRVITLLVSSCCGNWNKLPLRKGGRSHLAQAQTTLFILSSLHFFFISAFFLYLINFSGFSNELKKQKVCGMKAVKNILYFDKSLYKSKSHPYLQNKIKT